MDITKHLNTNNWFNYSKFYDFISKKDFKKLVEIGVWKGHSLSYLAKLLKAKGGDYEIYAVDLFENTYRYSSDVYKHITEVSIIYDIYNDNLKRSGVRDMISDVSGYSWEEARNFEDSYFDFIFIDADHSYESVVKDLNAWYPKIKKGGIFSGHDYTCWAGVNKAVNEFALNNNLKIKTYDGDVWYIEII